VCALRTQPSVKKLTAKSEGSFAFLVVPSRCSCPSGAFTRPTTELLAATESYNLILRVIVSITNNVGLFGVSVVFIILCAQNMTDLLQDLVPEMDQCLWTLVIS
jgi:hypothetical protein